MAYSKRQALNILRAELELERSSHLNHWRLIADYIRPRRARFSLSDTNKGERRNQNIIDSTATFASNTFRAGMMSGVTHPARPWFRLATEDAALDEVGSVKDWLHEVTERMRKVFSRSNLYTILPQVYGDMGDFGTSPFLVEEDFEKVVRFQVIPIGTYCISANSKGKIDTYHREFYMSVRNVVEEFGRDFPGDQIHWDRFSDTVKTAYENDRHQQWVTVCHVIRPNPDFDPNKKVSKYKKFESCYYEKGSEPHSQSREFSTGSEERYLREKGYDYFPILCARWMVNAEESYATDSPGMTALGDIKALQTLQRMKATLVEKAGKPPMIGNPSMRNARISHIPGEVSWVKEAGDQKLRPMYDLTSYRLEPLLEDIAAHQARIKKAYYEDLFLMMSNDDRNQRATAEEIIERRSEKMVAVGPAYEQLNEDVFDDLMDITFHFMLIQGKIPPPPKELQGRPLRVEYVSIMAQAQKSLAVGGLERFMGFTTKMAADTQDPSVLDKIDRDQMIDEYGSALGVSPKVIRSDEDVAMMREGRAQAQRQQMQAEQAAQQAKAVKDLSQSDLEGDSALSRMVEMSQAGSPLPVN